MSFNCTSKSLPSARELKIVWAIPSGLAGWVGFTSAPLRQPLLGYAGFLQFFTATFHGDREEVELAVNAAYPGK